MSLTPKARQQLKAKAHKLKPIVLIGNKGLTDAVKKEINIALNDHELIKIRVATEDRDLKKAMVMAICEALHVESVQLVGKISTLYRKNLP